MPPASFPNSAESNHIVTLPLQQDEPLKKLYNLNGPVPRVTDFIGNAGAVFVARNGEGMVSLRKMSQESGSTYLAGLDYNFVGVTCGGVKESSQYCGVNVCGSSTLLHCQPYRGVSPNEWDHAFQIGARVAFDLPDVGGPEVGQKRYYQQEESDLFANDGIQVRRSYLTQPRNVLIDYVGKRLNGTTYKELAEKLGVPTTGSEAEWTYQACWQAERHYTFGISLCNLKRMRDSTSIRVLISPV